jgi:hypothetical protein
MEVTRFRLAASLSTKAQSVIAVMDTRMMGAERDEAAAAAVAEPVEAAANGAESSEAAVEVEAAAM